MAFDKSITVKEEKNNILIHNIILKEYIILSNTLNEIDKKEWIQ